MLVNPRIVATGKGKVIDEEGCLSFPGMRGNVRHVPGIPPPAELPFFSAKLVCCQRRRLTHSALGVQTYFSVPRPCLAINAVHSYSYKRRCVASRYVALRRVDLSCVAVSAEVRWRGITG